MHPLENAIAAIAAVGLWEVCRWAWLEVQSRRAIYSHSSAFWAVVSQRFKEADGCPPAEVDWDDYNDEDWIS